MSTIAVGPHARRTHDASADGRSGADEWPAVWFTLVEQEWSSLALVPAHPDQSSRRAAQRLADIARQYEERPVHVLEAEHVTPAAVRDLIRTMGELVDGGARVLVALSSPVADVGAIPLAREADAAVLLVPLGLSRAGIAQRAVRLIGEQRFVGAIAMEGPVPRASAPADAPRHAPAPVTEG